MRNLNIDSCGSILTDSARVDLENLTDKQFSDMLEEFNLKANLLKDLFTSLNDRISETLNEPAGNTTPRTSPRPAISFDDEVQAFKQRELEKLGLGYIIPVLKEQEVI